MAWYASYLSLLAVVLHFSFVRTFCIEFHCTASYSGSYKPNTAPPTGTCIKQVDEVIYHMKHTVKSGGCKNSLCHEVNRERMKCKLKSTLSRSRSY